MTAARRWRRPLRRRNIDSIPVDAIGIYGFWHPRRNSKGRKYRRCLYIGKAERQSIRVRVHQEWMDSHNSGLKKWIKCFGEELEICYLRVSPDRAHRIDSLETRLIHLYNPETNIKKRNRS